MTKPLTLTEYHSRLWKARDWHLRQAFLTACETVRHRMAVEKIEEELKGGERDRRP